MGEFIGDGKAVVSPLPPGHTIEFSIVGADSRPPHAAQMKCFNLA